MPETMPRPAETCGASTRGIRLGDNPPYYLGPCVLRKDHDGPVHQAEDGAEWMGDVGSDQPTTPRREVPDELTALIVPVLRRPCPRCDGNHTPTGVDVHCSTCMDSGSIGPVYAEAEAVEYARGVLAAVLPAHERQVREQVARDIEANPSGECSGAVAECARIARGTDPADPPDPRLSELTTRAAAIDLPSQEPDITDALRRIRRDIRLALTIRYDPHANPAADLERELGNMIVSSLRWMRVYGLDPLTCIETAERVQRERAEREGR